jgi:hypothetical protein
VHHAHVPFMTGLLGAGCINDCCRKQYRYIHPYIPKEKEEGRHSNCSAAQKKCRLTPLPPAAAAVSHSVGAAIRGAAAGGCVFRRS